MSRRSQPGQRRAGLQKSGHQHGVQQGRCRLIAGRFRGRIIRFDDAQGLRPTTDRIRETIFNWLQPYIVDRRCLDAFAGSGALGFEALSRGAKQVTFLEQQPGSADRLRANAVELLGDQWSEQAEVVCTDALHWLSSRCGMNHDNERFGLVFLDPPYHQGLLDECFRQLHDGGCLTPDALIYVEYASGEAVDIPEQWRCLRSKQTANIAYGLYLAEPSDC